MTNFEYYKKEILELTNNDQAFMVYKNGKIGNCDKCHDCKKCLFDSNSCNAKATKWLYEEHKEQPKLTKKERQFCELIETGYICRDNSGDLWWFKFRPNKTSSRCWDNGGQMNYMTKLPCKFLFIKWEDEEPWKVEELLKLEVE